MEVWLALQAERKAGFPRAGPALWLACVCAALWQRSGTTAEYHGTLLTYIIPSIFEGPPLYLFDLIIYLFVAFLQFVAF